MYKASLSVSMRRLENFFKKIRCTNITLWYFAFFLPISKWLKNVSVTLTIIYTSQECTI